MATAIGPPSVLASERPSRTRRRAASRQALLAAVKKDVPAVDRIDREQILAPRVFRKPRAHLVLRRGVDDQERPALALERASEDDEPVGEEGVHERGVLVPQYLVADRSRRLVARAGVATDDGEHHRSGSVATPFSTTTRPSRASAATASASPLDSPRATARSASARRCRNDP